MSRHSNWYVNYRAPLHKKMVSHFGGPKGATWRHWCSLLAMVPVTLAGCGQIAKSPSHLSHGSSVGNGEQHTGNWGKNFSLPFAQRSALTANFSATLNFSVDPRDPSGSAPSAKPNTLEAREISKGVKLSASDLDVRVFAKKAAGRGTAAQLEIFVYNKRADTGVRNLQASLTSSAGVVFDASSNLYNSSPISSPLQLGQIAPEGVLKFVLVVESQQKVNLNFAISGEPGLVEAQNASPIRVTKDGAEVWLANAELGFVAVTSTAQQLPKSVIKLAGKPRSLAFSPDQSLVYVALSEANQIVVIDRNSMAVVAQVGEAEGLDRDVRSLIVSPFDGALYVSSFVEGTVQKWLPYQGSLKKVASVQVGAQPTSLSLSADGSTLVVPHFLPRGPIVSNESWVSVIDTVQMKLARQEIIEDHFNLEGEASKAACLAKAYSFPPLGKQKPEDMTLEGAASQLAGVFMPPSGGAAWVPGTRITGAVVVLERGPKAEAGLKRFGGLQPGQYVAPIMFMFNASRPGQFEAIKGPSREIPTLRSVTDCYDHNLEMEFINSEELNKKGEQTNKFLAYAVGNAGLSDLGMVKHISFSRGGRRALLLANSSDEIAVYDAASLHPVTQKHFMLSGHNPVGMDIAPDGNRAYVLYENSPYVSVIDISSLAPTPGMLPEPMYVPYRYGFTLKTPIQLGTSVSFPIIRDVSRVPQKPDFKEVARIDFGVADTMPPEQREGKILFQSANPEKLNVSLNRLGACASCHPDGGNDGSSWATMEGERRTISLRGGVAGRGWLHASGTHPDAKEFAVTVVKERLGGELTENQAHAMASYLAYGIPKLQAPKVDLASAERGAQVFAQSCQGCHAGKQFTSGNPDPNAPFEGATKDPYLFDIGTGSKNMYVAAGAWTSKILRLGFDARSAEILDAIRGDRDLGDGDPVQKILDFRQRPNRKAGMMKAPSLVNVRSNAIFFHDGAVATLRGAVERIDSLLRLGLTEQQIIDVTTYLETL